MTSTIVKFCAEQTGLFCPGATDSDVHVCTSELLGHTDRRHVCECGYQWGPALAGAITIDDARMHSIHFASHTDRVGTRGACWRASWWLGRGLDRNQAISAVSLAEVVIINAGRFDTMNPNARGFAQSLCEELDVQFDEVVRDVLFHEATVSGFVTLSVRDAAGEWQRVSHVRSEHLVDNLGNSGDLAEVADELWDHAYAADLGVEIGTPVRVALVDAFGTPAVQYETPARAVADQTEATAR